MQKVFLTFVILLTCSLSVMSARDDKGPKVVCGPYVQCLTEDSFTVIWVTDMDAICWIETAPDDGTHFYHCNRTKHFDMRGQGVQPIGKIHKIKVVGLEKGSSCRYRLMSKGVLSFKDCGDVKYTKLQEAMYIEENHIR